MSVNLSVVYAGVRALLNDDNADVFTDAVQQEKAKIAHREIQVKLREIGSPLILDTTDPTNIAAGVDTFPTPADFHSPIALWEATAGSTYYPMTECTTFPENYTPGPFMNYWKWSKEILKFPTSTGDRSIKMLYKRSITFPAAVGNPIGIDDGELYMIPRTAALCIGAQNNKEKYEALMQEASLGFQLMLSGKRGSETQGEKP